MAFIIQEIQFKELEIRRKQCSEWESAKWYDSNLTNEKRAELNSDICQSRIVPEMPLQIIDPIVRV